MGNIHFDNATVGANIQNLTTELVGKVGDGLQMLMLVSESLANSQLTRVEILGGIGEAALDGLMGVVDLNLTSSNFSVVVEELLEVLGAKNVDLGKKKLTLNESSVGVVENGPNRDQILELSASLLNNTVLASEDNGHTGEIVDLSVTHDKRVNVETTRSQNTRDSGQDTGLVLDKTVKNVALGGSCRWDRSLIENVGDGRLGGPGRRAVAHGERSRATAEGLVGDGRGRGGAISHGGDAPRGSSPAQGRSQRPERCHLAETGE